MSGSLKRNTVFSALEVICAGFGIFLVYKVVVLHGGLGDVGLWSLVLATTSLARFGDLGAATGLSRFVATSTEQGDLNRARAYSDSALLINIMLYGALGLLAYVPLTHALGYVVSGENLGRARALLPYAFASFLGLNLAAVTAASVIGLHRADLKSIVMTACVIAQVVLSILLVPQYGLVGLAVAQVVQSFAAALVLRAVFVRLTRGHLADMLPCRADCRSFREIVSFGVKLQAANLVSFAFEPASKFVMTSFGGIEMLGLYEMANRMVLQVRTVVASSGQALGPAFAAMSVSDPGAVCALYLRSTAMTVIVGTVVMVAVAAASPMIGLVWIGRTDPTFVTFAAICSVGWLCNLIGTPAYALGIARGRIVWNLVGHIVASFIGPTVAIAGGMIAGEVGIVVVVMTGLAAGALLSMIMNCRMACIPIWPSIRDFRDAFASLPGLSKLLARRQRVSGIIEQTGVQPHAPIAPHPHPASLRR